MEDRSWPAGSVMTPVKDAVPGRWHAPLAESSIFPPRSSVPFLELPSDRLGDLTAFGHHLAERGRSEGLESIAQGFLRIGVNLDHKAIGAGGDGSSRHRSDQTGLARAVAWIDDNGEMRRLVQKRDRS